MTVHKLSALQMGHVRTIVAVAAGRGLDRKAAVYAVATSGAEASLTNWENHGRSTHVARGGRLNGRQLDAAERARCRESIGLGDGAPSWGDNLDSMGLFAQRFTEGWGEPRQLMDPRFSTGKFLDGLVRVRDWATRPAGEVLRAVQGFYSDIYSDWLETAEAVVPHVSSTGRPSGPAADTTTERDWFEMATLQDLDNALDKLADKIVTRIFDRAFVGEDAYGKNRNGAPFHQMISALLKTSEDQSGLDEEIKAAVSALRSEVRALRDAVAAK